MPSGAKAYWLRSSIKPDSPHKRASCILLSVKFLLYNELSCIVLGLIDQTQAPYYSIAVRRRVVSVIYTMFPSTDNLLYVEKRSFKEFVVLIVDAWIALFNKIQLDFTSMLVRIYGVKSLD